MFHLTENIMVYPTIARAMSEAPVLTVNFSYEDKKSFHESLSTMLKVGYGNIIADTTADYVKLFRDLLKVKNTVKVPSSDLAYTLYKAAILDFNLRISLNENPGFLLCSDNKLKEELISVEDFNKLYNSRSKENILKSHMPTTGLSFFTCLQEYPSWENLLASAMAFVLDIHPEMKRETKEAVYAELKSKLYRFVIDYIKEFTQTYLYSFTVHSSTKDFDYVTLVNKELAEDNLPSVEDIFNEKNLDSSTIQGLFDFFKKTEVFAHYTYTSTDQTNGYSLMFESVNEILSEFELIISEAKYDSENYKLYLKDCLSILDTLVLEASMKTKFNPLLINVLIDMYKSKNKDLLMLALK